jgi:hypothetical protein
MRDTLASLGPLRRRCEASGRSGLHEERFLIGFVSPKAPETAGLSLQNIQEFL